MIGVILAFLLPGCVASDAADDGAAVTRTTIGDTTIVRTDGPGMWGDSVQLVEELSIGVLEGDPNTSSGR